MIRARSSFVSTYRQGGLHHLGAAQIEAVLGFAPNAEPTADRTTTEWLFEVDGVVCGIWDWRDSSHLGLWSFYGPRDVMVRLFGADHVS